MSVLGLKLSTEKSCVSAGPEVLVSAGPEDVHVQKSCVSAGPEVSTEKSCVWELCQCWA